MDHKELDVWNAGVDFVVQVYESTKVFPKEELYGLTNQIRRAAVSIPSNIAEGDERETNKESIRFFYIAKGYGLNSRSPMKLVILIKQPLISL